jgi:tetratricopeptide (TPR) repeat protein
MSAAVTTTAITPTLCLNMIVKNESRVILRLLQSCVHVIDSYCITDTGSTDNTVELIENFFREKGIPGSVIVEPFRNFGYNRTFALDAAAAAASSASAVAPADYLLLLDADMILQLPENRVAEFKQKMLEADAHYIYQGNESFYHKNVRVLKNKMGYSYWGVTHEYVKTAPNARYQLYDRDFIFINDRGDGGCKQDKYQRDINLITEALKTDPNNDRYHFYLGNSLHDSRQFEEAIRIYKRRIELGGWFEEVWYSYYRIGICYKHMGKMDEAVKSWMDAYQYLPNRIENLFEIIQYYRNIGKNNLAYMFYVFAKKSQERIKKLDFLFLQRDVYDYKLDYEMTIIGYYCNYDDFPLCNICIDVLNHPSLESGIIKNIFSNYKFYAKNITSFPGVIDETRVFAGIGKTLVEEAVGATEAACFASSTPSLVLHKDKLVVNVRWVNYRIGENGEYINREHITTVNVIAIFKPVMGGWKKIDEFIMDYDKTIDDWYVGLEDVRLLSTGDDPLYYNCNRGMGAGSIFVETGTLDLETRAVTSKFITLPENQQSVEKNWVMFPTDAGAGGVKYIYGWYPLRVGDCNGVIFEECCKKPTPHVFKHVRGSTNGCKIGDEIWFMCHAVSYESRRYYYHIMVVLDAHTFELKRYTPFFTFEKKPVEYCLGFVFLEETREFLIGYSLFDRETKYMRIPYEELVNDFVDNPYA